MAAVTSSYWKTHYHKSCTGRRIGIINMTLFGRRLHLIYMVFRRHKKFDKSSFGFATPQKMLSTLAG